jgi:dGTPase
MEVAQIARGLVHHFKGASTIAQSGKDALPSLELIEAIAFAHDLGHPPFGHGGEVALNFMMRDHGGFEGNGQSLRILCRLEMRQAGYGLDLTRRTLLGILKYPRKYSDLRRLVLPPVPIRLAQVRHDDWKPPKCFLDTEADVVEWLLEPFDSQDRERLQSLKTLPTDAEPGETAHKAFDTSIMELADDIAYGVHDFEDGVALGLIVEQQWYESLDAIDKAWAAEVDLDKFSLLGRQLFDRRSAGVNRKQAIGAMVHALVISSVVRDDAQFSHPYLRFQADLIPPARAFLKLLRKLVNLHVIKLHAVQSLEYRGRLIVMQVFEALQSNPDRLLTPTFRRELQQGDAEPNRVICDYVSGMTDAYATRLFERLYVPRHGTVFERL